VRSVADFLKSVRENLDEPGAAETLSLLISRADHDAEFALIIGPLLFQAVIARRPVTDEFLAALAAASARRSGR